MRLCLVLSALLAFPAIAQDFQLDFTAGTIVAGSGTTAVADRVKKNLHVPFIVDRNCDSGTPCATTVPGGTEDDPVDIGTGADGAFDSTTAFNFDLNHGADPTTVTIDSSRDYHFTSFTLPATLTLRGSGTRPLIIHVQGDMHVDGIIDVKGQAGGTPTAFGGATPLGGVGVCGGVNGGDGGDNVTLSGRTGQKFDTAVAAAGGGGGDVATAGGGGGGGSQAAAGTAGTAGGGGGGTLGAAFSGAYTAYGLPALPAAQVPYIAGAGGGGGGYRTSTANGGGGGAGGGALFLQVGGDFAISSTGKITADGGPGGGGVNSGEGCGGGGAGGTVLIFAGGTLFDNHAGSAPDQYGVRALGGNTADVPGGTGCGGGNGGNGAKGVLRLVSVDGTPLGSGSENPPPAPPSGFLGTTRYTLQPVRFNTDVIDTGLNNAQFSGVDTDETTNGGTVSYAIAGSTDAFVADDTGFLDKSDFAKLNGKRYLKVRITLQSSDRTLSPQVRGLRLHYSVPEFDYRLAGCARIHPRGPSAGPWWTLFFLTSVLSFPWILKKSLGRQTAR